VSGRFLVYPAGQVVALATGLAIAIAGIYSPALAQGAAATPAQGYEMGATSADARLGAELGAGSQWESQLAGPSNGSSGFGFGGGVHLGCSGLDFNGFLHSFDPAEMLSEIRNSLLTGAQAAASNFLITLAYADPTLASVLDMMDKKYSARFSAFAQACDAQSARARGQDRGARAMAQAGDQCYDLEVAHGTAPSEAYRRCSILHSFDSLDLPATASTADFLRKYTHVNVTHEIEALLNLLPDERVQGGAYQMQPAQLTIAAMSGNLRTQTRIALDRLDTGANASDIPLCKSDNLLGTAGTGEGCLPSNAAALVTTNAFRSSRLLSSASRVLFKEALSSQIAIGSMYANLLELFQQTARIDVRSDTNADAAHAVVRRRQMRESIADLLLETDAQVKAQAAKMQLVRMQMLALEQVETDLNASARRTQDDARVPQFGMRDFLQFFSGGN
jgi:hypothetical protein